ncbi:MAG: hypothetical protein ACK5S6_00515 [bacterium]
MKTRMGRPPKTDANKTTTLTIRLSPDDKRLVCELADGYDMTLTEYLMTLVQRDASSSTEG